MTHVDDDRANEEYFKSEFWAAVSRNDAAQPLEVWNCKVGDFLEIIGDTSLYDWPDGPTGERIRSEMKCEGQIYRVADLKGRGFDLELVSGNGPPEIRAMNSEIPGWAKVVPAPALDPEAAGDG